MKCFESTSTFDFFPMVKNHIKRDIENYGDKELLLTTDECLVDYFKDKHRLDEIAIFEDKMELSQEQKMDTIERYDYFSNRSYGFQTECIIIDCIIPITGYEMVTIRPSTYILTRIELDFINHNGCDCISLKLKYSVSDLDKEDDPNKIIMSDIENSLRDFKTMANYLNSEIRGFNSNLESLITALVKDKKTRLNKRNQLVNRINIPLKNSNTAKNGRIEISIQKKVVDKPTPNLSPETSYEISDEDYLRIVKCISEYLCQLENTPSTVKNLGEEEIRNLILANLNSVFNKLATGETFRKNGKTDICITHENKAAFIAECKIWGGKQIMEEALKQLLSYSTWRDSKLSLLFFNKKNKNYIDLLNDLEDQIKAIEIVKDVKMLEKNRYLMMVKSPYSENLSIKVEFLIVNFCI